MNRPRRTILLAAVLSIAVAAAWAEDVQVNTYTTGIQDAPSVAMDADGDFVVVWGSLGSGSPYGPGFDVHGQRYAADGSPAGGEFIVNSYTGSNQIWPAVAMDADGDFVVVWESQGPHATDPWSFSIQAQRYAADGSPVGGQFQVNTHTLGRQWYSEVAMSPAGEFVVVWHSNGSGGTDTSSYAVLAQLYASDGSPVGGEFQVNTTTTGNQGWPSVAMSPAGEFVVAWYDTSLAPPDTSFGSIQGQRYAADGSPVGGEFQVNTFTTGDQWRPSVGMSAGGDFTVVWSNFVSAGTPPPRDLRVQGQRFAADGSPLGDEFQVNTYTAEFQTDPRVAVDADGDFVVVWPSYGSGAGPDSSSWGVLGRRYLADGTALGGEFQINTYTTDRQSSPAVAADPDGDFVVAWESLGSAGTDTDAESVQMKRFPRSMLWVPGFEADAVDPEGPTTFFAVRNTSDAAIEISVEYHGEQITDTPLRTDVFPLGPRQTLTRNVRSDLTGLDVSGGVATGLILISETGRDASRLEGDFFRVDSGNDFAAGDRLVRSGELCARQEVRFVDFGSGSGLRILLEQPQGVAAPSFAWAAYDEAGALIAEDDVFTSEHLTSLDVRDLFPDPSFGSLVFDFSASGSGFVTADYSAFGRFSAELNGACRDATAGAEEAALIVPGFEVEVADPQGPTTLFAVRNTTDDDVEVNVAYFGRQIAGAPLRTDVFMLAPRQTLTRNVRADLTGLDVSNGVASGLIVIAAPDRPAAALAGDYFRLNSRGDFATGDRLVRPEQGCARQEVRLVDFGSGSRFRILLAQPQGDQASSFSYTAYDEAGAMVVQGDFVTSEHLTDVAGASLVPGLSFGTLVFDFTPSVSGFVTAEYSAFDRFSVELDGACASP